MASSPCDCWTHLSQSLSSSSSSPSSSSLPQTLLPPPPSSSSEHVWNDIKLPSLSNSPVDFNPSSSHSSLLSLSSSHNHHSLLSVSNASFPSNQTTHHQDQRHVRIMKNRESAVRSRARKQAYRRGLEAEIARLTEENSRLRKQLKELQCSLSSSENTPDRISAPCRTSSSPF
ncbi:hypothetical protein PHAVU_009G018700 [Phaseolus vulgaris]|uniref:BZIP domain-containing protein n=1 Tax=Phaseolus vulgaris TaxID=3885 RepID=V7AR98_PHAVU|nr:hypothetical protein PHAVU_009G018700g [Phaseolus vulgaris]ESW08104.1 hypothetical protein PHAVU_009G018700g [Phaseolus vulgaris]